MVKSKLNPTQERYQKFVKKVNPRPNLGRNLIWAFFSGGLTCVVGQFFINLYAGLMKLSPEEASNPAAATMIFIGALLTGLGYFDKIAIYAGAGIAIPVTGFANSIVSAALEYKKEGFILGIGSKMFILAGSVITYGVVTAFFVGIIHSILK